MRQTRGRGSDGIELNLGNGQIVVFVLVALGLLGVTFALGIKVGQQLGADEVAHGTDTRATDRLAALDARAVAAAPSPTDGAVAGEGKPTAETLTFAQELTRPAQSEDRATPPAAVARPAEEKTARDRAEPQSGAPIASAATAPEESAAAGSADAPPVQGRGNLIAAFEKVSSPDRSGFALQVASLPNARAAQEEVARLAAKGLSAWIRSAEVKGSTYYRIKVGPYATKADAQAALDSVARASGTRPIVVNAD